MKKILKILGFVMLSLLLLLVITGVLLLLPPVQTFIAQKATAALSEKTGGRVSVGKVTIRLPDGVQLRDLYAEDLNRDTLVYTGLLKVNISLFHLLKQQVKIDNIFLENAVVMLQQNQQDSTFNFQYLVDAFAGDSVSNKNTEPSPWTVAVNEVNLANVTAAVDMPLSGVTISGTIGELGVSANSFDLSNQAIAFDEISLQNSTIAIDLTGTDTVIKQNADTSAGSQFLIPTTGWKFSADKIDFAGNHFSLDDHSKPRLAQGVDFSHLDLSNLNIQISDALYEGHLIRGNVKNVSARDQSGFQLNRLEGKVTLDSSAIAVDKLALQTNNSRIQNSTTITFDNLQSLEKLSEDVRIDAHFNESYVSLKDVLLFAPELANSMDFKIDSVFVDGSISGTVGNLTGQDLIISAGDDAYAHLTFSAKGLPDIDNAHFTVNIEEVTVDPRFISSFNVELPQEVLRLGRSTLTGKYTGTITKMDFDGAIATQLGRLDADLNAQFNPDYSYARYNGVLQLQKFQLGTLLGDSSLGTLSLYTEIKGSGLSPDTLQATLKTNVQEIVYRNYNYEDIAINGSVDKKKFSGTLNIDDENLLFDFSGIVDFNDSVPAFEFDATLDTINLGALNLLEDSVGISAEISVDFRGLDIDHFNGHGIVRNIRIASDTLQYTLDSISARAYEEGVRNKVIEVTSPIVNAKVTGDFNAADLPRLLVNYVNDYFPISAAIDSIDKPERLAIEPGERVIADQNFEIVVTFSQPRTVAQLFVPEITYWDTAYIVGKFDSKAKNLQLEAAIPGIAYGTLSVDTISITASGNENDLVVTAKIDDVFYDDKTTVPDAEVNLVMANDELDATIYITGDSVPRLGIEAHVDRQPGGAYRMTFEDTMHISGARWTLPPDNYTDYRPGYLFFHNFSLSNNNQKLSVTSSTDTANAPITIGFKNFNLHELSTLADYDEIKLDGNINGTIMLKNIYTTPSFTADLNIADILVNENPAGDLRIKAAQEAEDIAVNVNLQGAGNDLNIAGKIFPEAGSLDLDANIEHLNLNMADAFLTDYIGESEGYLSANVSVKGKFAEPGLNGNISFHGVSTRSAFANARFRIADNTVDVSTERISVNRLQIYDEQQRQVVISGNVKHKNFQDIELDLSLNTNEFQFLNSTKKQGQFFYGKVILAINGTVKGPIDLPVIDARAATRAGTRIYFVPAAIEREIKQENFVIFRTPPSDSLENIDSLAVEAQQEYKIEVTGVDLNLAFELTPDAQLQIIIDPISGDSLTCIGSANLVVDIPPAGTPQVTGAYIINRGSYAFSYQQLLKKNFTINKDSRIDFTGDIMNARLNITAQYTANATTYELIASQSSALSASEEEASKKRAPVHVLLKIRGDISQPELTFDIQLPPDQSSLVTSTVARKLSMIRENPAEINKQAFALLMFNSFIAEEGSDPDYGTAGENIVLRSVSNLISNQLNRLANKVQGFEINLDLSSYSSKYETAEGNDMLTDVGIDISKQFLGDRLEVTVGGNVNVESSTTTQQTKGNFSNVTGDFTIEYKLTESGKYRVKVYSTSDFDVLNQSNVYRTGIGLTYRESFRKLLKRKKDQENKTATP